MNTPRNEEKLKEIAGKICYLTGFGQALHPNDIIPDLKELILSERTALIEENVEKMVNRFLAWKLPMDFHPDAGISFKAEFNENTDHPMKHEPTGTNLFDYTQAKEMIKHMLGLSHLELDNQKTL